MCFCVINNPQEWSCNFLLLIGDIVVCVYLMRGEYDDRLVWPFHGDITVQLVNLISDQNHQELTFKFDGISSCSGVTSRERATIGCRQKVFHLHVHKYKNPIYVKDDCVKFRVTKILLAS